VQATHVHRVTAETKEAIYNLFAAYLHSVPLEQLIESVERTRREAQLRYVVIYGPHAATALRERNGSKGRTCERLRLS
jgi:hypothetical protein